MSLSDEMNDESFASLNTDRPKGPANIDVTAFIKAAQKIGPESFPTVPESTDNLPKSTDKQWTIDEIVAAIRSSMRIAYCPLCEKTYKLARRAAPPACSDNHPPIEMLVMTAQPNTLGQWKPIDPWQLLKEKGAANEY